MPDVQEIPGMLTLWAKTLGDPEICVAILDGLVDQVHPCFQGANLTRLPSLVEGEATTDGKMSRHGTHVTSIIFGQHNSAPGENILGAQPHDARQMVDYLVDNTSEAKSLIWTLNLELTPIYAIEPSGPFADDVYDVLQQMLAGQLEAENSVNFIQRVSVPGKLTDRTVKLFSGQVIPVIETQAVRGMYGWNVNVLVDAAIASVQQVQENTISEERMRRSLQSFLNRVYYDLRNLGQTARDRALNFAVTNAFQAASTFSAAVAAGMELDTIEIQKSPFCRLDSDCWDVKLKFFDPENSRRARRVFRFTIDVRDFVPVTLGEVRVWSESR